MFIGNQIIRHTQVCYCGINSIGFLLYSLASRFMTVISLACAQADHSYINLCI